MSLLDPALLPSRQIVKNLAQMPFYLAEQRLLAALGRKHDVVLALILFNSNENIFQKRFVYTNNYTNRISR
jgi:hypothetical protein